MDESLAKIRHERSVHDYPDLSLQDGEYIEFAFKRANICRMMIIVNTAAAVILILFVYLIMLMGQNQLNEAGQNFVFIILFTLLTFAILGGVVAMRIYKGNRLFITNRRVIQRVMTSPMFHSVNVIDLGSVEDASFHQNGLLSALFHLGTLRLSTIGDETTYTFKYSDISHEDLESVSKLISDAKKKPKE
ncbi:PH domain-containing protein [Candidatus Saccharibacteria bacterium]|nr:PH domain-containing protein [Candidatus Saccharibacteria bacterium]